MVLHGFLWYLMDPYSHLGFLMVPYGPLWSYMVPLGPVLSCYVTIRYSISSVAKCVDFESVG